jgi:hypothetical protein
MILFSCREEPEAEKGGIIPYDPYVFTGSSSVAMEVGQEKTITAEIKNYWNDVDDSLYEWELVDKGLESPVKVKEIKGNEIVIEGLRTGDQKLTVKHEVTKYKTEIWISVREKVAGNYYITCDSKLVLLNTGETKLISVNLTGGNQWDFSSFNIALTEGQTKTSMRAVLNQIEITGISAGDSTITVKHPKAVEDLKIKVIVTDQGVSVLRLECADGFELNLGINNSKGVNLVIENENMFIGTEPSYELSDYTVAAITSYDRNGAVLKGLKTGKCVLTVKMGAFSATLNVNVL